MTERPGAWVGSFTTELSVAVELRDTLTGEPPRERPRVTVTNADHDFLRNPSGYHVLVDLPPDPPTLDVVVASDAYLRKERTVDRSSLGEEPLVTIDLVPGPAYPFGGVTLVRGAVEEDDDPVAGATVSFVEGHDETRTTTEGEFALPITGFGSGDVTTASDGNGNSGNGDPGDGNANGGNGRTNGNGDGSGTRVIEPGGGKPTIRATHPDGRTTEETVTLPVGRTTSVTLAF